MDKEEINKFLTKAMGECWHDGNASHPCTRCGLTMSMSDGYHNITFLTWEGFGKLWEWARKQDWWHSQFEHWLICDWHNSKQYGMVKSEMVNPENFAKAVVDFLQKKSKKRVRL